MAVEPNRPGRRESEVPLSEFVRPYTRLVDISPRLHVSRVQLLKWIAQLPVLDSLVALSRVDALLYSGDLVDPGLQQRLAAELFRNDDLGPLLTSYIEQHPSTLLFHPRQVYLTMSHLASWSPLQRHYNVKLGTELARAYTVYSRSDEFNTQIQSAFGADPLAFWSVAFVIVAQVLQHSRDFLSGGCFWTGSATSPP